MSFGYLFSKILVLFIFLVVGFIACKTNVIDGETNKRFTKIVLNISSPAIVLASAFNAKITLAISDVFILMGTSCLMLLLMLLLAIAVSWVFGKDKSVRGIYTFMMAFGNVAFMGYPVISAIFGSDAVFIASICVIPMNFLIFSLGIILISGKRGRNSFNWRDIVNPPLIGTAIALVIFFLDCNIPEFICEATDYLGNMVVPSSMLIIGASLGTASFKEIFGEWRPYILCVIKLIIAPLMVWFVCRLFIKNDLFLGVLVILSSMPVAAITPMISYEYGGDSLTASRGVFITTLVSMLTIPFVALLII